MNTSVVIIFDEGGKAIGYTLKVNTSLTKIYLLRIILVMKGKRHTQALKVNTSL